MKNDIVEIKYKKYEFCKSKKCSKWWPTNSSENENCSAHSPSDCVYTAKEFHKWLKKNEFKIVKK